jgi:hypothetical protein
MNLFRKERLLTNEEVQAAIKTAVSDATLAATLASHMAQCEKDKGEMKAESARMHSENTKKFETLFKIVWVAAGASAVLSIGGKELLAKIIGG